MKKAFILFVILLILGFGGICYAHTTVNARKDQVTVTETVLAGEPAVAEGVTVNINTHYDNHLFWNTTYTPGEDSSLDTEYSFSAQPVYEEPPRSYGGVFLESYMEYGVELRNEKGDLKGLALAYRELYDSLEPGEEKSQIVYVKDYYDFYPISGMIDLPGFQGDFSAGPTDMVSGMEEHEVKKIQEYFKIPVIEEETREISVGKGRDGSLSMGSGSTDSDEYHMYTHNALGDNACYFTFDTHSYQGKVMDMSYLPDGYGVYCIPYSTDETGETDVDIESLSMVYALDPEVWIVEIAMNARGDKLLLITQEEGIIYLTVIETESMKALQKLKVAELVDAYIMQFAIYEDFLVWFFSDERIVLVSESETGEYRLEFIVATGMSDDLLYSYTSENAMDWNGEQLVIATFMMGEHNYRDCCSFYLTFFDKNGLAYCGQYTSSLDTAYSPNRYSYRCRPYDYMPISVRWGN